MSVGEDYVNVARLRFYLSLIICCLFLKPARAQEKESKWLIGTGVTYDNYMSTPGLNLNVTYRIVKGLHIGPDFSALLNKEENENGITVLKKELEYNFNANYLFHVSETMSLYPLIGISFSKITVHPANGDPDKKLITALNAGSGFEFELKGFRIFFESKYVTHLDKYDLTLGTLFKL